VTQDSISDHDERLRLGGAKYLWRAGQLHDARGRPVPLRAKSLKMFSALLDGRGTVISKDQLCDLVWPDVIATDDSIARCVADIRKALSDNAHRIVETLPKQGYRLNVADAITLSALPSRTRLGWLTAATICGLAGLAGTWWVTAEPARDPATQETLAAADNLREAVAILPFSASGEEGMFLAAALADDIEIHLAEMSAVKIVSQAQTLAMPGAPEGPVAMALALDARYLVLGSVRYAGTDIAVSVQLVNGSDGTTLWADRYEGPRSGLPAFRLGLPQNLIGAMPVALDEHDRRRLAIRDSVNPVAFEEVMLARRDISTFTYEGSLSAERHLRRALALDPNYARAYAELAAGFAIRFENNWVVLTSADAEKALYFAERALELDPDLWLGHYASGRLHSVIPTGDIDLALKHLRKAMSLQPANDDARAYYGVVTTISGRPEDALPIFESIMATNPLPSFWYYQGLGNTLFHLGRYEEAEKSLLACLNQMPNSPYCQRILIATYARLGRVEDAEWMLQEYEINGHDISIEALMKGAIETDPDLREDIRQSYLMVGVK